MGMYFVGYGIGRFWVESIRIDSADQLGGLRWNQWVALAMVAGGVMWLFLTRGAERSSPGRPDENVPEPDLPDLPASSN
jgi:prolipoprotein diacylglyceryltransferase